MLFDDRLATVLRHTAQSESGARTQYRQLLDLLGSMPPGAAGTSSSAGSGSTRSLTPRRSSTWRALNGRSRR